jgi:putative FmdB family regulatory protein
MPLYTYLCKCGKEFDSFKSCVERKTEKCPECGKKADKLLSGFGTAIDSKYKDILGSPIWFPKDGKPYYDRALGRSFSSKAEKCGYMKQKRIVMDGSSDPINWPIESGSIRDKHYRKQVTEG